MITLSLDELEALRLADYEGLYQEQAARRMNVSRQTFGNIVTAARKKVADFLVHSKLLSINGGHVEIQNCQFTCNSCKKGWSVSCRAELPNVCPGCNSRDISCTEKKTQSTNHFNCWRES